MGPRERRARSRAKTHTVPLVIASLLGFMLIGGIAFGVGMVANVNRWLSDLPDYTDANQYLVSEPTEVLDANGNKIASLYVQNRQSTTMDKVSQYVLDGTVATEDERYYEHGGIDLIGIARAVVVQLTGGSEGASTITQQLVRNTILSEEQFDQTIERKVREAWIAIKMEEIFSKDEILMMYLNTIYYGHGAYGIETAAETYFSKSAADLTLAEAALLVGLPNAPSMYDPTVNPDLAVQRRNIVLDRMLRNGYISQEEYDAAQAEELNLNVTEMSENGTLAYPYFVDYVKSQLQEEFSTDMIFKGGLTVKTTIDPTLQAQAESAAVGQLDKMGADELQVGMTVIDPKTGYIKAMVGGRDYNADEYHTNHALVRRSTGSSFKMLTLAAAIHAGMNPNVTINCSSPMDLKLKDGTEYTVQNYGNHNYGTQTLAQATAVSSNTGYVQVQDAIGYSAVKDMCDDLGIDTSDSAAEFNGQASLTLGTANLSTLEMAEAAATYANGGKHRDSVAITEILSRDGKQLYTADNEPTQVLTAGEAEAVTTVLEGVLSSGTGRGFTPAISSPTAGKTGTAGTASDTTDLWFVGYSPQLAVAIWTGRSGSNEAIGYGTSDIPLPIFYNFMTEALSGAEAEQFPTGTAPKYKDNSTWKFAGGTAKVKDESEEEQTTEEESEGTTEDSERATSGNGSTTGGSTSGGNTGGGTVTPVDPTPTPTPTPEPAPTPTPGGGDSGTTDGGTTGQ